MLQPHNFLRAANKASARLLQERIGTPFCSTMVTLTTRAPSNQTQPG
jgi:hypothetical protein